MLELFKHTLFNCHAQVLSHLPALSLGPLVETQGARKVGSDLELILIRRVCFSCRLVGTKIKLMNLTVLQRRHYMTWITL